MTPRQIIYNQVTAPAPGVATWQQIGRTLEPGDKRQRGIEPGRFSQYEILQLGHIQPYTPEYRQTGTSPLRNQSAPAPMGPFKPYPQVQNAAIISAAALANPQAAAAARSAYSNGLQGGVM